MCIVCTDSLTGKSFLVSLLTLTGFPRKCHATHCVLFIYYLLIILPTEEKPEGTIIHGLEMVKLNEMTQAQLRSFIPRMLRATTGESPQWGKEESKPLWWPSDIPFQNIRKDERSDEEKDRMPWWPSSIPWQNIKRDCRSKKKKGQMSWTSALQELIIKCYRHYGKQVL